LLKDILLNLQQKIMKNKITQDTLVLIPSYNEGNNVMEVINELKKYFKNLLVINDGSNDNTKLLLNKNKVSIINHYVNLGQGAALETGLEVFIKDPKLKYVITFDADGQHRPSDAYKMLKLAKKKKFNAVIGTRFQSKIALKEIPFLKRITLILAKIYERFFYGIKLSDAHNGLRVLEKELVINHILPIKNSGMNHGTEISSKICHSSLKYIEYPVIVKYMNKKSQSPLNAINILVNNIFYH